MICLSRAIWSLVFLFSSLAMASDPAMAKSGDGDNLCHLLGSLASESASQRDNGTQLHKVMDRFEGKNIPEEVKKIMANIALKVFKSTLTPDDAYITYRESCLKDLSAK